MRLLDDLPILYRLALKPVRGASHAERLESFYGGQAAAYDDFRKRLLKGRSALYRAAARQAAAGGVWVDMGGGTGANLDFAADLLPRFSKVYLVDLAPSLLEVARVRIEKNGWSNVTPVLADATGFVPPEDSADLVTFSYSLTMIPDWFAAVDHARRLLRPGGLIGAVDFFVARKHPAEGFAPHGWFTRTLWPAWFAFDNVMLSPDHVPYLHRRFERIEYAQKRAHAPYLPGVRMPYYQFLGRRPVE